MSDGDWRVFIHCTESAGQYTTRPGGDCGCIYTLCELQRTLWILKQTLYTQFGPKVVSRSKGHKEWSLEFLFFKLSLFPNLEYLCESSIKFKVRISFEICLSWKFWKFLWLLALMKNWLIYSRLKTRVNFQKKKTILKTTLYSSTPPTPPTHVNASFCIWCKVGLIKQLDAKWIADAALPLYAVYICKSIECWNMY